MHGTICDRQEASAALAVGDKNVGSVSKSTFSIFFRSVFVEASRREGLFISAVQQ